MECYTLRCGMLEPLLDIPRITMKCLARLLSSPQQKGNGALPVNNNRLGECLTHA
jgi:hypothetical protein